MNSSNSSPPAAALGNTGVKCRKQYNRWPKKWSICYERQCFPAAVSFFSDVDKLSICSFVKLSFEIIILLQGEKHNLFCLISPSGITQQSHRIDIIPVIWRHYVFGPELNICLLIREDTEISTNGWKRLKRWRSVRRSLIIPCIPSLYWKIPMPECQGQKRNLLWENWRQKVAVRIQPRQRKHKAVPIICLVTGTP